MSVHFVYLIFSKTFIHASKNSLPVPESPNNDLIWPLAIVIAAAVVNPDITDADMNCTKKPKLSMPSNRVITPERNASNTANSGDRPEVCGCVIIAIIAVGPIVAALQLPKNMYTKHPMKPEYKPYCGSNPATTA